MHKAIIMLMVMAIAGTAIAQDLGNSRELPVKSTPNITYVSPAEVKVGGDTFLYATEITGLPYSDMGNTYQFVDDYDEACPFSSTSPDVTYSFRRGWGGLIDFDLCGSSYDTKLYIYDQTGVLMGCSDDFYGLGDPCGSYVSAIFDVPVTAGTQYWIVIDGSNGDSGDYVFTVSESSPPCDVICHVDAVLEGEPPLVDGYLDEYNGGCNSPEVGYPFQYINWTNDVDGDPPLDGNSWLCGTSGWYYSFEGGAFRDTDWFSVVALETRTMEVTLESEYPCYLYKMAPLDCENISVELQAITDCEEPAILSFPLTAGEEAWLWVGPTTFTGPVNEFTYFLTVDNNFYDVIPNEEVSWGEVKALYR